MIHAPKAFGSLSAYILASYEKQQRRVLTEFGGDEDEVRRRVARMREWMDLCSAEKRDVFRATKLNELFGKPESPSVETMSKHAKCQKCLGAGMYWSENCTPRRRNVTGRSVPGFVVCNCESGNIKNTAVLKHGTKKERPMRGAMREEF